MYNKEEMQHQGQYIGLNKNKSFSRQHLTKYGNVLFDCD